MSTAFVLDESITVQRTVGEAFARAKKDMAAAARKHSGYHWVQAELNLLGEPRRAIAVLSQPRKTLEKPKRGAAACKWRIGQHFQRRSHDDSLFRLIGAVTNHPVHALKNLTIFGLHP